MNWQHITALAVLTASLSGCITLLPEPGETVIYGLRAPANIAAQSASWTQQLVIERPVASGALDSNRIATISGREMRYYAGVSWADPATRMLQSVLLEALENSGAIPGVSRDEVGSYGELRLRGELRQFAVENGTARVEMHLQLVQEPRATVMAARRFSAEKTPTDNSTSARIAALEAATQAMLAEIVRWVLASAPPASQ